MSLGLGRVGYLIPFLRMLRGVDSRKILRKVVVPA